MAEKCEGSISGFLLKKAKRTWTGYVFEADSDYLQYFTKGKERTKVEELPRCQITQVTDSDKNHKNAQFPFEVYFSGKNGSPWQLDATSQVDRQKWKDFLQPTEAMLSPPLSPTKLSPPTTPMAQLPNLFQLLSQQQSVITGIVTNLQCPEDGVQYIKSIAQDHFNEEEMIKALQMFNMDSEAALNYLLQEEHESKRTDLDKMEEDSYSIKKESLSDIQDLTTGQSGVLKTAMYKHSSEAIPLKVVIKSAKVEDDIDTFHKEIIAMKKLGGHPNIVKLYGSVDNGTSAPWLVLEYFPNGDLRSFLQKKEESQGRAVGVHKLVKYMLDVASGMIYLSALKYVHRDLDACNILVTSAKEKKTETCKVGDFGMMRKTTGGKSDRFSVVHGVKWMAPESIKDGTFSSASDVWSFGILMWEMFNPTAETENPSEYISSGVLRLPIPVRCPEKVANVMQRCWEENPIKRPSFGVIHKILYEYLHI